MAIFRNKSIFFLVIPLVLSAFTHLWNPAGFPHVAADESVYLLRAMHVLEGQGPQVRISSGIQSYDHPYFGQLFLGGMLKLIGYPNSFDILSSSARNLEHSIELLYLVPRILMGLLAIGDTFLVYKIAERRYGTNIALIASILFAVMPITWLTRWILLDSIMLPLILGSILLATYDSKNYRNATKKKSAILFSGIFLGLAIFTKIPALTMIPLVVLLIYKNNSNGLKASGLWLLPVILIPSIWPAYTLATGQFNLWQSGIYFQTHRGVGHFILNSGLVRLGIYFFKVDPVLFVFSVAGLVFAVIKRDYLILLWIIPYLVFFDFIATLQNIYIIPLVPVLCIAAAKLINDFSSRISKKKVQKILPFATVSVIGIFGLVNTTPLITQNVNSPVFESTAFVINSLQRDIVADNGDVTVISYPTYSWVLEYVFHFPDHIVDYSDGAPSKTKKVMLISDWSFTEALASKQPAAVQIMNEYHPNSANMAARFSDTYTHIPISIFQIGF